MATSYIQQIRILNFWGKYDISWDNLNSDVNILVGINGSGKTSILNIINAFLNYQLKPIQKIGIKYASLYGKKLNGKEWLIEYVNGKFVVALGFEYAFKVETISTFDVIINKSKLKSDESPLMLELRNLILQTGAGSFNDYRLSATTSPQKAIEVTARINEFFSIVDKLFSNTNKKVAIDSSNNLIFQNDTGTIQLEQLSSGEKQLLLILFKVFLMNKEPNVLLMDEPEISLHISWQQDLIEIIRTLNPNCQLIIATHSPSIFGKGWGDKITFMDNLIKM